MERKQEFAIIEQALEQASISKINDACRLILNERIESIVCSDREILRLTKSIISGFTPCIEIDIIKSEKTTTGQIPSKKILIYGILGALGVLMTFFINIGTHLLGCAAIGAAAYMSALLREQSKERKETTYKFKIKQKVEDIINELDEVFGSFKKLLVLNQLENQYSPILRWLQELWAESNEELQRDINRLLNQIKYEFVDYSNDLSAYFDANKAPDIEEATTTRPALRNKATGDIAVRGYVIIPL